jgi:hypothetical protein
MPTTAAGALHTAWYPKPVALRTSAGNMYATSCISPDDPAWLPCCPSKEPKHCRDLLSKLPCTGPPQHCRAAAALYLGLFSDEFAATARSLFSERCDAARDLVEQQHSSMEWKLVQGAGRTEHAKRSASLQPYTCFDRAQAHQSPCLRHTLDLCSHAYLIARTLLPMERTTD